MNEARIERVDVAGMLGAVAERLRNADWPLLIALDGRSGAGKSTLAAALAAHCGGVAITADDFWIGGADVVWDGRDARQKADLAIDWRRLRAETLEPLLAGRAATWRPFDWASGHGLAAEPMRAGPTRLVVLDGAYSSRPELQDLIDLSILVEVADDAERRRRLVAREGAAYTLEWHARWDEAEDHYFAVVRPRAAFDLVVANP